MKLFRTLVISFLIASLAFAWGLPATQGLAAGQTGVQLNQPQSPLAAAAKIIFNNKTGVKIDKLVLTPITGPKTYTFYNVAPGKTEFNIEKGKYSMEYSSCGKLKVKKVNITGTLKLNTASCPTANVTINNITGGTINLTLTGPTTYRFTLPSGKTKITVWKGDYDYSCSGRCGTDSGEVKFKNRLVWTWYCY